MGEPQPITLPEEQPPVSVSHPVEEALPVLEEALPMLEVEELRGREVPEVPMDVALELEGLLLEGTPTLDAMDTALLAPRDDDDDLPAAEDDAPPELDEVEPVPGLQDPSWQVLGSTQSSLVTHLVSGRHAATPTRASAAVTAQHAPWFPVNMADLSAWTWKVGDSSCGRSAPPSTDAAPGALCRPGATRARTGDK